MKPRLILAGLLIISLFAAMTAFNHQKPRILVLHSYTETGLWEQALNRGIQSELSKNLAPISVRWHYMSFTNEVGKTDWDDAGKQARQIIGSYRPDILMSIGEEAQEYVGRHYANQADMRIVYATSEDPARYSYLTASNVTGVKEVLPLAQIVEMLHQLGRPSLRIRVLGMDDPTGRAEREQVQEFSWSPHRLIGVQLTPNFSEWKTAVRAAAQDADVLIVLSFNGLPVSTTNPRPVDNGLLATWTEHESKPLVIGIRVPFVAGGGALAVVPSAEGMGAQLARQTLGLLKLGPGNALPPPQDSVDFLIALRPGRLAARKVTLPAIYTQAARASHTLFQ